MCQFRSRDQITRRLADFASQAPQARSNDTQEQVVRHKQTTHGQVLRTLAHVYPHEKKKHNGQVHSKVTLPAPVETMQTLVAQAMLLLNGET